MTLSRRLNQWHRWHLWYQSTLCIMCCGLPRWFKHRDNDPKIAMFLVLQLSQEISIRAYRPSCTVRWRQTKHRRKGRDMAQSIMHMVFWSTNIYGWEIIRNMYRRAIKETIMHHKFLHKYHQFWFSSFILEAAIVGEWQRGGICFFCCWWQQSAVMLPDTIPAF